LGKLYRYVAFQGIDTIRIFSVSECPNWKIVGFNLLL
jgi:hypothetical protein